MALDEKVTEGRTVQELRGSIFQGPLLFPKDRPLSLYTPHHGPLAPFPLLFFIYCPSTHLLDWRSKQKLLFSASWRRLQGERRRRGVLSLTGELLPIMTRHTAACVLLSRPLSLPLHTHRVFSLSSSSTFFLAKVSRGKTLSWRPDKLSTDTAQTSKKPQPSQTKAYHIITTQHKITLTSLPSKVLSQNSMHYWPTH